MTHDLKTFPHPFQAILDGVKRFEFRRYDRPFRDGDVLRLREFSKDDGEPGEYTGREMQVRVTYILNGPSFGIPTGYCCMSIEVPETCAGYCDECLKPCQRWEKRAAVWKGDEV